MIEKGGAARYSDRDSQKGSASGHVRVISNKSKLRWLDLQGLLTNDVSVLQKSGNQLIYAALLNAQGRHLHDLFLHKTSDTQDGSPPCLSASPVYDSSQNYVDQYRHVLTGPLEAQGAICEMQRAM